MIIAALIATATTTIEIDGLEWKLELPDTQKLSAQSSLSLAAQARQVIEPEGAAEHLENQAKKVLEKLKKDVSALQELELRTLAIYRDWLCASVRAVRSVGQAEWEPIAVTADPSKEDEPNDILWVGRLSPRVVMGIGNAIAALAKETAGSRVGRFQGRSPASP